MLKDKLKKGLTMIGEYHNDDDSGLDPEALEMEEHVDPDKLGINLKVISTPISSSKFPMKN